MSFFDSMFDYLKLPLIDVQNATNHFADEKFIRGEGSGKEYKGRLVLSSGKSLDIVARRLDPELRWRRSREFKTEIMMLASLKHQNVVSIVGFCDENEENIIVTKLETKGSLDEYLSDPITLPWTQRLQICLGIARALSYIHYDQGRNFSVIHRDIKSSKILLDDKWEAKLSGFEFSTKKLAAQRHGLVLDKPYGTPGYMDPAYVRTESVSHKSDMYSLGVVLFEVLTGRKAFSQDNEKGESLAELAKSHYENETLNEIIHPGLLNQINSKTLKIFSEAAYRCLNEQRAQRPSIDKVIFALDQALKSQLATENSQSVLKERYVEGISTNHWKGKDLEHLKIGYEAIKFATGNFDERYLIGSGGYGAVYKAELEHFDSSAMKGNGESKLLRRRSTVAIKYIFNRENREGEQGFIAEIETLSNCVHPNIVSLLGFCHEPPHMILVYEHVSNGSLDDYLGDQGKMNNFTWVERLKICIGIARGLDYMHTSKGYKPKIIHRDIKSANILLDKNWEAKIADFRLSKYFHPVDHMPSTIIASNIAGTQVYLDPAYEKTHKLKKESDVFSFGVVLFEILCGRLAYDQVYTNEKEKGLAPIAREHFEKGTINEMIDPNLKEEGTFTLSKGPNQDSLNTFLAIGYRCLAEKQAERPTMKVVIEELEKALNLETYGELAHLVIRLEEILSATNNFGDENLIKEGGFGKDYKGQMPRSGKLSDICARRLKHGYGDIEFWTEISMLSSLEHKNIISLVGFCDENDEKIIIYEHAVHGSLDQHLSDPNLTWFQRLQICLGVARALSYIHYDVIHCDINSSKIFLDKDWEPKIFGFELSTKYPQSWRHRLLCSRYFDNPIMTPKYDVYSFGVLLFEVVYGKKPIIGDNGVTEELTIDQNLRKQMDTHSLALFTKTTYNCLNQQPVQRPPMDQIIKELEDVFELQWKHENLEHSTAAEATSINRLKMDLLKIPLSEILLATNNFDQAYSIGFGGFGVVYKATLEVLDIPNLSSVELEGKCKDELPKRSKTVAIKRIIDHEQGKQGFLTEIDLLTSCKHPNIVSLLGFSNEGREMILVYEYAFKGSLNDYFGNTSKINLTWTQKLQICIDIARGINYLHTNMEGKPRIIHRDIKSDNILLDENLNAKVADFGLSKFQPTAQQASTVYTKNIAGTDVYLDPEYLTTGKYKKESDVYSFGVVLFEIICGRPAYDSIYMGQHPKGLAPIARRRFSEGTLKELIDPTMIEEDDKNMFTLNRGPNQDSFEMFSRIAYQCLAETQARRPTMEAVIKELHNALKSQGEAMALSRFRLSDILSATKNFSDIYCIGLHEYGAVYQAELDDFENKSSLAFEENKGPKTRINVAIKRIYSSGDRGVKQRFFSEIEMRTSYKHPNVVSLLGFCYEGDETILVYEYTSNKSLDDYLKNVDNMNNLTWTQRLHLCLGIACGLNHLHTKMDNQEMITHGDIKSANILLGRNWEPKIAYFGISKFDFSNQESCTLINTKVYWDPEFEKRRITKKEYDIYSFGVILFEIFCGRLAYDSFYLDKNEKGLTSIVRSHFNNGTIKELLDHKLKEVIDDDIFNSNRGPNQDSLDMFLKIAYQCLEETQVNRPTMEIVIKELEMALDFQKNLMKSLQISLEDIRLATDEFSQKKFFGSGSHWDAYIGKPPHANATIVAKRWNSKFDGQFRTELDILSKRKHKNIIRLVGCCNETNEKIIVYEHMSKGSLDKYLSDSNLRWMKRLRICIDVVSALEFLHGGDITLKKVVHRNIKSHGILLNDNWDAKISNFELSSLDSSHQDMEYISNDAYLDPQYKQGFLTEKSDIYSFGVSLFEILCGRLAWVEGHEDNNQSLGPLAKHYYEQGKLGEMVFEHIKKQIVPQSLSTFVDIAYQCLYKDSNKRPKASEVAIQLKKALKFQEDFEIWEPKLPSDYKEIIRLSETPEIKEIKDIYEKLSTGILLPKEKVWIILSDNGKSNKMISATSTNFSYKKHESHKCRSIRISRFPKVAKILDISNLKIQVTIDNQFLSPDVIYGVYLVFKFSNPRNFLRKHMYMNLKYNNETETLHSHFATSRDEDWMMIELHRHLNRKDNVSFTFLLESFSRYYCGSGAIYIEGIEFSAIKKVAREDIKNLKVVQQVQNSNSDLEHLYQVLTKNEKLFLTELNGKKLLMLSATEVLYNSIKSEAFRSKSSADSRFPNVMELLPQQVFRIKYKIKTEMLSPFIEYTCYLVFKVSEKCRGLHCPVKIRDLLYRRNKENQIIYFRSPDLLNHHEDFWVPEQRKDGWMEVMVWKFKSKSDKLGKNYIPMNLKLVAYEGTMSGLILCGLEFRPT